MLTPALIQSAAQFLDGKVRRTPLEPSPDLSAHLEVPVWLKLESLQLTGSFKIRGAWFALSRLTAAQRRTGVLTCSAGNHGKALAYVAKAEGVHATICVPKSVDEAKYRGMVALGAEVRVSPFAGYDETEDWALEQASREGKHFLSAFDDYDIMAANGGALALEVLDQAPDARAFILPVGGGGMAAGFAFHLKNRHPDSALIGCQHQLSPGLARSLEAGRAITRLPAIDTVAGGVEGGLGKLPYEVLHSRIDRVALLSESEILEGVRWILNKHQYLVEPSAAVTIAACLSGKIGRLGAPAVVVLSGRNVSSATLKKILCPC